MAQAWEDTKRLAKSAFSDISNSYQDILIRGHLMPNRQIERDIAEAEYDRLHAPEQKEELFYFNHFHGKEPPEPVMEPEV